MVRVLQNEDSIELQTLFVPSLSSRAGPRLSMKQDRKTGKLHARAPTLSMILYGSMDMFESIGDFLSQCSEYLQPPLHCDRSVPYCNPQSLTGSDKNPRMTFQLQENLSLPQVETVLRAADPSAVLETEDSFLETDVSAAVKSSLYRYVLVLSPWYIQKVDWQCQSDLLIVSSHQKRALSFMLMRERDVQPFNNQEEQWRAICDEANHDTK